MIKTIVSVDLKAERAWLGRRLSSERLSHSLGAHDKAIELAEKFHLSPQEFQQAAMASLLHDAAKLMGPEELFAYCEAHGLEITEADRTSPQTLHPFVGAEMVRTELGVEDDEILNAIRYHTTGRPDMSRVEKIVFIADKIEENTRNPLYIQKVTAHLNFSDPQSLDETLLYLMDSTIAFVVEKRQVLHPRTIDARNDLILKLRRTASHYTP